MIHVCYEGGDQPTTAAPVFVPNAPGNRERESVSGEVEFEAPATLSLYCATQGASVAYALGEGSDDGDSGDGDGASSVDGDEAGDAHWHLYTGPIDLPGGETTVRAKAIRYGYEESDAASVSVTVEG